MLKMIPLLFLFLNSSVFAQNQKVSIEKVETPIRLLGRGIIDKDLHTILSIACVGHHLSPTSFDCGELRWAVQFENKDTYLLGEIVVIRSDDFKVSLDPNGYPQGEYLENLKEELKQEWKDVRKGLREGSRKNGFRDFLGYTDVAVMGTGGVIMIATGGTAVLAASGILWGVYFVVAAVDFHPALTFMDFGDKAAHEQFGWNWTDHPKKMKHEAFFYYLNHVGRGNTQEIRSLREIMNRAITDKEREHISFQ